MVLEFDCVTSSLNSNDTDLEESRATPAITSAPCISKTGGIVRTWLTPALTHFSLEFLLIFDESIRGDEEQRSTDYQQDVRQVEGLDQRMEMARRRIVVTTYSVRDLQSEQFVQFCVFLQNDGRQK